MKKLFSVLLFLLLSIGFPISAAADVVFGPVMAVAYAAHYWYVVLLILALILVTVILIRKLKK